MKDKVKKNKFNNSIIASIILITFGMVLISLPLLNFFLSFKTLDYMKTEGFFINKEIEKFYQSSKYFGYTSYNIYNIKYKYEINNKEYYSKRISYKDFNDIDIKHLIKNDTVNVYFDINNPDNSVLIPGVKNILIDIYFNLGFIIFIIGIISCIINLNYYYKKNNKNMADNS